MREALQQELDQTLNLAMDFAKKSRHEFFTVEHIFYALLENRMIKMLLNRLGVRDSDMRWIMKSLEGYLEINYKKVPLDIDYEPAETLALTRVMDKMLSYARIYGRGKATLLDMIYFILDDSSSYGTFLLSGRGVDKDSVKEVIDSILSGHNKNDIAVEFCVNITEEARQGHIDPIIGRSDEIDRVMQILCRRKKNNPLLLGEPGVGKSAIVEGLALAIASGKAPDMLKNCSILSLDGGSSLFDKKYRGDFEKKLKDAIEKLTNTSNAILIIDEIHTILGTSSSGDNSTDLSNMLKASLNSGKLRCIGTTTYREFGKRFSKNIALSRCFAVVNIKEPSVEEAYKILLGLKSGYEEYHKVEISDIALKTASELAKRYMNDRFLPDSAIDLIDETCASFHLAVKKSRRVSVRDVGNTLSKMVNIPNIQASNNDKSMLKTLSLSLKSKIFGQDSAIDVLVNAIKRSRAGLGNPTAPIGSFLFVGPTGVGKTEVAKQLAYELGVHFDRYDMSEYMENHMVSKLIGSPPGYVGFEDGGQMTNTVRKYPHCVLLLDEIEKAHVNLINILLQVLDNATLTDNSGRKTDFRNVIVIMTSNLGTKEAPQVGFTKIKNDETAKAIKGFFAPEFRNRIDAIVEFKSLGKEQAIKIVEKLIYEIQTQLKDKNVKIETSKAAKEYLADKGFSAALGARQIRRVIDDEIKTLLTDEILFGKLKNGGTVKIGLKRGKIEFTF